MSERGFVRDPTIRKVITGEEDANKCRLWQGEQLLKRLGYHEVPTPDGPVWKRGEDDAVESVRSEGGPEEELVVGHVGVLADADGSQVVGFSRDWNEALLAKSTASQILRHEMSDKWMVDLVEKLMTAGVVTIYFSVTNTADGRWVDIFSVASGCKVIAESGIVPEPTRGTT